MLQFPQGRLPKLRNGVRGHGSDVRVKDLQRLNAAGPLEGTGLRFVSVAHSGNQSDSPEEVEVIATLVEELLRSKATWTNKNDETHPLRWNDILIVAPYNAQVALLKQRLPSARVGTVDKFQGQEAPVVFY